MRKVEAEMVEAIRVGYNMKSSNTEVRDGCAYLHGNMIYRRIDIDWAEITFSGWKTRTTSSRLAAIMWRMGYKFEVDGINSVSSSDKNPMDAHGWYRVYRS